MHGRKRLLRHRGAAPESKASQVHYPGTYAAGVYNRLEDLIGGTKTDHESLVNLPNWLPLTFRIDGGDWFDVDNVTLLSYRQTLDLRGAVLSRELRFRDDAGRTASVTQHRLVAMNQAHVAPWRRRSSPRTGRERSRFVRRSTATYATVWLNAIKTWPATTCTG